MDQILPFLPKGADFSYFVQWAPKTAQAGAFALAVIALLGIVWIFVGGVQYAFHGRNIAKRKEDMNTMKHGFGIVAVGILFGFIITTVVTLSSFFFG